MKWVVIGIIIFLPGYDSGTVFSVPESELSKVDISVWVYSYWVCSKPLSLHTSIKCSFILSHLVFIMNVNDQYLNNVYTDDFMQLLILLMRWKCIFSIQKCYIFIDPIFLRPWPKPTDASNFRFSDILFIFQKLIYIYQQS